MTLNAKAPRTLYDKLWSSHLVRDYDDGSSLIYVDRHLLHEVTTPQSFVALDNGKQFTLVAHNCSVVNKYIQSARINGAVLRGPWFSHRQLEEGGVLELEMGPKPNKAWGADATIPGE